MPNNVNTEWIWGGIFQVFLPPPYESLGREYFFFNKPSQRQLRGNYFTANFMTGPRCTQLARCPRLPGWDPLLPPAQLQPAVGLPQCMGTAAVAGGEGLEELPQQHTEGGSQEGGPHLALLHLPRLAELPSHV